MLKRETRERMRSATAFTLKYAGFIAVWVLLGYIITGGGNLERRGYSLWSLLAWYFGAAVFIGLAVGWLRPWASSRARGALVGFAVAVPLILTFNFTLSNHTLAGWKLLIAVVALGLFLGAPIGAMYWHRD